MQKILVTSEFPNFPQQNLTYIQIESFVNGKGGGSSDISEFPNFPQQISNYYQIEISRTLFRNSPNYNQYRPVSR